MKCPECDSEQPDNAILCEECGLSFEMWRQANPEAEKGTPAPEPEMTFPVPEEDKPAPKEEPVPEEKPDTKTGLSHEALAKGESSPGPETAEPSQAGSVEKPIPGDKKNFKWTPLYSAGLVLFALLTLVVILLTHRTSKPTPHPLEENTPSSGTPTPAISSTPSPETPTTSPQATGTPENSLLVKTPTSISQAAPVKAHSAKQIPTSTSTTDNIIQPEETLPTTPPKPASASNSKNEGQELSAPISKEQKIGATPTELPVSAIWADSPTPSPETSSTTPTVEATAPTAATSPETPISSPSDILESPEPKQSVTPSSTP